jgi:hypothetical protein
MFFQSSSLILITTILYSQVAIGFDSIRVNLVLSFSTNFTSLTLVISLLSFVILNSLNASSD